MKKIFFILALVVILGSFSKSAKATGLTENCLFPCFPCPTKCPTPTQEQPVPTPTGEVPGEPTLPPSVGGDGGGSQGGGPPGPPHCGNQTPARPYLRSLAKIKYGEAELFWDPVELATHYTISYGPSSGNYLYGVPNTGKVSSFRVGDLGALNYCFVVRAVNDCAPSEPSNELCLGGQVLGAKVLGATGERTLQLWQSLFIMAVVCGIVGARNHFLGFKKV